MRGSLSSPSYLVRNPTLAPQLGKTHRHLEIGDFFSCLTWRAIPGPFSKLHTKEKAIDAADQLVTKFKDNGYETTDHFEDVTFKDAVFNNYFDKYDSIHTRLTDGNGEVEITVEKKIVR